MQLVKRHLDALRDGVSLLQIYQAELTTEAIRAVSAADGVVRHQVSQLRALGIEATNVEAAATRITAQLKAERPWVGIGDLDEDLEAVRAAYISERSKLLEWQGHQAEAVRQRIKARDGFSTLTGDQSHKVLRPLREAQTDTTPEAIAPALVALKDPFMVRLSAAEEKANGLLDEILSAGDQPLIVRVDLTQNMRHRVLQSEADVEGLVEDIRQRLLSLVQDKKHIRLV